MKKVKKSSSNERMEIRLAAALSKKLRTRILWQNEEAAFAFNTRSAISQSTVAVSYVNLSVRLSTSKFIEFLLHGDPLLDFNLNTNLSNWNIHFVSSFHQALTSFIEYGYTENDEKVQGVLYTPSINDITKEKDRIKHQKSNDNKAGWLIKYNVTCLI